MNTAQRRTEILKLLQQAEKPVAARAMASQFGVSRQVIVQDMAGAVTDVVVDTSGETASFGAAAADELREQLLAAGSDGLSDEEQEDEEA